MHYFLGAIIGASIITFLISRIINRILRNKFTEKKGIIISFFLSTILILTIGGLNLGIVRAFFIYEPFLLLWLSIDMMNADINE